MISEINTNTQNGKLIELITKHCEQLTYESYKRVYDELLFGNSELYLPSINDSNTLSIWHILKPNAKLKLTSIHEIDGIQSIGVFTSEKALINWTKSESGYTVMKSKDVFKLCESNNIFRIIIDSDSSTMFVLEYNQNYKQPKV
ncbi:MAG: SseB family protein [Bacteroidales bacterium]